MKTHRHWVQIQIFVYPFTVPHAAYLTYLPWCGLWMNNETTPNTCPEVEYSVSGIAASVKQVGLVKYTVL